VPPPGVSGLPAQPPPVAVADNNEQSLAGRIFGGFFGSKSQVATADQEPATTGVTPKAKLHAERTSVAEAKPRVDRTSVAEAKPKLELRKSDNRPDPQPQPQEVAAKPAPQREANAAAMDGARPAMPAGNFDSRWGGLQ